MTGFDRKSAERIAKVVGFVEGQIVNRNPPRGGGAVFPPYGFWAAITATDNEGTYSWKSQKIGDDGKFTDDDDGTSGSYDDDTGYAIESLWNSEDVLLGSIVWMYPALSQEFFVFSYSPGAAVIEASGQISGGSFGSPTAGTGGIVQEWNGSGFVAADPADNVTIWNPYPTTINADTKIECVYINGSWFVSQESDLIRGHLTADLAANGTATMTASAGGTYTVTDFAGHGPLSEGAWVAAGYIDGVWTIIDSSCP